MQDMISMAIDLHLIFIAATLVLAFINLFMVSTDLEYVKFTKKIEFVSPQYYILLSAIAFTGIVILGAEGLVFSFEIFLMIIVWIVIVFLSVKKHKMFKKTAPNSIESNESFKAFAKKKYLIDMVLMLFVICIVYLLRGL